MLVAQAHSFTQQARLAITLAWIAGYTNILTLLTCGVATSHVSGTTSQIGHYAVDGAAGSLWFMLFLVLTFVLGAALSGVLTETGRRRGWNSIYVLPIAVEAVLLGVAALALEWFGREKVTAGWPLWSITGVASAAMGLQNATITRISNGVVRTTHVTGVLTDLGLETVQFLWWMIDRRRNAPPLRAEALVHSAHVHPMARRLALLGSIVGSFALGAGLGTLAHAKAPTWAMFPPVVFLLWLIYVDLTKPIAEIEPSDLVGGDSGLNLPGAIAVFHLRKSAARAGKTHRLPDMLAWSDRLHHDTRVVILDLLDVDELDGNAALELRAVLQRFQNQGRRLIIAGISGRQYEFLRRAGAGDALDPTNVCPDLELAIARGLTLLHEPTAR